MVAVPVLLSSHDVVVGGEADVRDLAADAELFLAFLLLESKAISSAINLLVEAASFQGLVLVVLSRFLGAIGGVGG